MRYTKQGQVLNFVRRAFCQHLGPLYFIHLRLRLLCFASTHTFVIRCGSSDVYSPQCIPRGPSTAGAKRTPHSPLKKACRKHTHASIHTLAGQRPCRKLHREIPARPGWITPHPHPQLPVPLYPPSFPSLSSVLFNLCVRILFILLLRPL